MPSSPESEAPPRAGEPVPWWARSPVRLAFLLVVLAAVAVLALARIGGGHGERADDGCWIHSESTVRLWPTAVEAALARLGLHGPRGTSADLQGLQEPSSVWSDAYPIPFDGTGRRPVDAGYEVRWWTRRGDHQAVAAFRFRSPATAQAFTAEAVSTHCRPAAIDLAASAPPGARAIEWRNPLGATQADVLFSRGPTVYRVVEVPPQSSGTAADSQVMVALAARVACRLPQAACPPGSA